MSTARRRLRPLVALVVLVALNGCAGAPALCAQLGSVGLCA